MKQVILNSRVTRKWNNASNNWNANYGVGNKIKYNTEVLKSNLCDSNDAYILVRGENTSSIQKLYTMY